MLEFVSDEKWVIATDGAGYGPQLGPLTIGAVAFKLASHVDTRAALDRLSEPLELSSLGQISVDDSNRLTF